MKLIGIFFVVLLLASCSSGVLAPVSVSNAQIEGRHDRYRVHQGDTLYSIAWAYGLDYRALAKANHLPADYRIEPGQILTLRAAAYYTEKIKKSSPQIIYQHPVAHWQWPAKGKVVDYFSEGLAGNHGINIAGQLGESVRAAAAGRVVYAGSGVRGYGNLIIIKHNANYLSAYAYNQRLLVTLNQNVQAGQRIALLGRNNAGRPLLHFEIRYKGHPVDPMKYLH